MAAAVSRGVPVPSLFSNLDESFHAKLRRSVNNAFALTTLIEYEPFVSDTVELFLQQMDARFANKLGAEGSVDWPRWLQFYAFDVIGELTYSSKHGFLKSGEDIGGVIAYLTKYMDYLVVVRGQVLSWLTQCADVHQDWTDAHHGQSLLEEPGSHVAQPSRLVR